MHKAAGSSGEAFSDLFTLPQPRAGGTGKAESDGLENGRTESPAEKSDFSSIF